MDSGGFDRLDEVLTHDSSTTYKHRWQHQRARPFLITTSAVADDRSVRRRRRAPYSLRVGDMRRDPLTSAPVSVTPHSRQRAAPTPALAAPRASDPSPMAPLVCAETATLMRPYRRRRLAKPTRARFPRIGGLSSARATCSSSTRSRAAATPAIPRSTVMIAIERLLPYARIAVTANGPAAGPRTVAGIGRSMKPLCTDDSHRFTAARRDRPSDRLAHQAAAGRELRVGPP
jgi:hypothetical protein